MAVIAQALDQGVAVDAFDGVFAGLVDVGDDDRVGVVETRAEFLEQVPEPGVAVRLDNGDDLSFGGGAGGGRNRR